MAMAAWQAAPPALTAGEFILALHKFTTPEILGKELVSCFGVPSLTQDWFLGQHYFVPNPNGQGLGAKWDFTSQGALAGNTNAFVVAAKVNQTDAPTGPKDIAWVSLKSVTGQLAQQIYRTDTRLGQPPATVSLFFVKPS